MSLAPQSRQRIRPPAWARVVLLLAALSGLGAACRNHTRSDLPTVELKVGGQAVMAEVANTYPARTTGLMFRKQMGKDEGMLFVFPDSAPRAFWMRNTLLPLSIAFLDEAGVVLNVDEMQPETEDPHPSKGSAKYVLEMNTQWFESNGVTAGSRIVGLEKAPLAEN